MPLQPGDRYALLAFEQLAVARGTRFPIIISDRVSILDELPVVPEAHWKKWLGTNMWERFEQQSTLFVLIREPNPMPGVLNHKELRRELVAFHYAFAISGMPFVETNHVICGNVDGEGADIRQHARLDDFQVNNTLALPPVDEAQLRRVWGLGQHIAAFSALGWVRIYRGFRALLDALKMDFSEDRLHLMVRAMDAIVKTEPGQGRVQFAERCDAMFLAPHANNLQSLYDMYFLRSAVEHVKDINGEPTRIANPNDRKKIRERRLRQLELLAMHVYRRIIGDAALRNDVSTDAGVDAFWAQAGRAANVARWNFPLDLNAIT